MTKRTKEILDKLDEVYTREYKCYLNHENPGQLLIATMLSAQCTDARVNIVTKDLFVKYPDMQAFAKADLKELQENQLIATQENQNVDYIGYKTTLKTFKSNGFKEVKDGKFEELK